MMYSVLYIAGHTHGTRCTGTGCTSQCCMVCVVVCDTHTHVSVSSTAAHFTFPQRLHVWMRTGCMWMLVCLKKKTPELSVEDEAA